jgi:hypothetical protein
MHSLSYVRASTRWRSLSYVHACTRPCTHEAPGKRRPPYAYEYKYEYGSHKSTSKTTSEITSEITSKSNSKNSHAQCASSCMHHVHMHMHLRTHTHTHSRTHTNMSTTAPIPYYGIINTPTHAHIQRTPYMRIDAHSIDTLKYMHIHTPTEDCTRSAPPADIILIRMRAARYPRQADGD